MFTSFAQLAGNKALNIPLAHNNDYWCRECGGAIDQDKAIKKEYKESWVDEGLINYHNSDVVCPACLELSKGSTSRTNLVPPAGTVSIVAQNYVHPTPAGWQLALTGPRETKRQEIFTTSITLIDFLENILPEIEHHLGLFTPRAMLKTKNIFCGTCLLITIKTKSHFI
ncbi:hypothetical protein [Syntrophomonas palmitatica]|uniref:hypothetical protein n=1 Tax=Syntrophomonas palmitatica TaxID=402877 RepID=UPI000B3317E9|nr:hypothetical protein [Syntrophomonas palmitatica]